METIKIQDATLIGSWEEVQSLSLSTITKRDEDTEKLDGLIVKGYETKFANGTNENGEQYSKEAIDEFIQRYFVDGKRNMPVDVQHDQRPEWLVGRIIYVEVNSTGFYFVAYIPRAIANYNQVKVMLEEGLLQGFSKLGYATDYHWVTTDKESGDGYLMIDKVDIVSMSLVSTPANGVNFEKVQEVKNALRFENKLKDEAVTATAEVDEDAHLYDYLFD